MSYLSEEQQGLQPSSQPEVVQCPGYPRTLTRQWQMIWLPSGALTFQAGLSVGEVLPVPRGYPSVPPQPRSALPGIQAQPATRSLVSSPSMAPALAARSVLCARCRKGLMGLPPPLQPLAME